MVTATPDVTIRELTLADEFIILASDGLWDVVSSQQAVNFVRRRLMDHRDVARAATELAEKAQQKKTQDNVTVVVLGLNEHIAGRPAIRTTKAAKAACAGSDAWGGGGVESKEALPSVPRLRENVKAEGRAKAAAALSFEERRAQQSAWSLEEKVGNARACRPAAALVGGVCIARAYWRCPAGCVSLLPLVLL